MICFLEEPSARELHIAGGKAAALARLAAANFPIPEGFIVTTPADPDLPERLNSLQQRVGPNSIFAIRSSGYSEDSPGSSFAGQYETMLGARGIEAVSNAIARCFASFYRSSQSVEVQGGAVIVQRLIEAEAAGVAFTVDPVTRVPDRICIEANFGLGDSVVGGHINPDGFSVIKTTGEIAERRIGKKHLRSVLSSKGALLEPMPEDLMHKPSLSDEAIRTVANIALRVEQLFSKPVDIEWAWTGGQIWLLQARVVTGLEIQRWKAESIM